MDICESFQCTEVSRLCKFLDKEGSRKLHCTAGSSYMKHLSKVKFSPKTYEKNGVWGLALTRKGCRFDSCGALDSVVMMHDRDPSASCHKVPLCFVVAGKQNKQGLH